VTHEYTILTGGRILALPDGESAPDAAATAIAWAEDTVLAVGTDEAVRAVSRGDSRIHDLAGAIVRPLGGVLIEAGAPADFEVLDASAELAAGHHRRVALVRGGRVVEGSLP
jgi:cytosine/adenosine deaminase-related metal-dependent hydrolase